MEEEGVSRLGGARQHLHVLQHVLAGGHHGRVVIPEHCDVLLLEAQPGGEEVLDALSIGNAALQC